MSTMTPFFQGDVAYKLRQYNLDAINRWLQIGGHDREIHRRLLYTTPRAPIIPADCMFETFEIRQSMCFADVKNPNLFLADCIAQGDNKELHCLIFFRTDAGQIIDLLELPLYPPAPLPAPLGMDAPPVLPPNRFPLDKLLLDQRRPFSGDAALTRSTNIAAIETWFSFSGDNRHTERLQYFTKDNPEYEETKMHADQCNQHPEENVFPDWGFYEHSLFTSVDNPTLFLGEGLGQGTLHNHPMMPGQKTMEAHYLFPFVMRDGMICDFTEMHIDGLPMHLSRDLLRK